MTKPKILCTGAPRSGTSLFNLLMSYFKDLRVCTESGTPKTLFTDFEVFSSQQRPDGKLWNDYLGGGKKLSFIDILKEGTKLISIYRDGRDCFVSARQTRPGDIEETLNRGGVVYESVKTETTYWYTFEEIKKWFNSIKETFKTLEEVKGTKYENNYLVIRYEDLVNNPEVEMKRVENFVGWPLDPGYLKFYEAANYRRYASSPVLMGTTNTIPVREDSAIEGAIGSDHEKHRPIAPDSIGRWKRPIHKQRMRDIITLYGDELTDMLIELKYETNKNWIDEIK
jgi:hypothetical protein